MDSTTNSRPLSPEESRDVLREIAARVQEREVPLVEIRLAVRRDRSATS